MPDLIVLRLHPINPKVIKTARVKTEFIGLYTPYRENLVLFA